MQPTTTIERAEKERKKNDKALDMLISEIRNDPESSKRENKLASAIIALKES